MIFSPITLKNLTLPINVLYAPLAGFTDVPFRIIAAHYCPGLMFCEMVKMEALVRADRDTFRMLGKTHPMASLGAQLCGSSPRLAGRAARILEDLGFDVIDLNCGCPVDKVTKDGSGAALLSTPLLIGDILSNIVSAVKVPVTVKIRAGIDENHLVHKDIVRIAELAGASALTIHGRTLVQGYTGKANRAWIKEAKMCASSIKVIGNGDIFSAQDAASMLHETLCDGVLIARGMLGQPWFVDDCRRLEKGQDLTRSPEERKKVLIDHVRATLAYLPDEQALIDLRRVVCLYLPKSKEARPFKEALNHVRSVQEMVLLIEQAPI
jgi:nifR3 family TIM-barrel protein